MKTLITIIVLAVLAFLGWKYLPMTNSTANTPAQGGFTSAPHETTNPYATSTASSATSTVSASTTVSLTATSTAKTTTIIKYTAAGFVPKSVSIKVGDTVTWTNETSHGMWVASAVHPSHAVYDGTTLAQHCQTPTATTFDQCKSSNSFTFTITKSGSWNYHDHMMSSNFGTVVVTK